MGEQSKVAEIAPMDGTFRCRIQPWKSVSRQRRPDREAHLTSYRATDVPRHRALGYRNSNRWIRAFT